MKGNKDSINATTDLYQLGITFYELLAGENPMACSSEVETLTKQLKETLPPSPRIPKRLMNVISKATEKEQGDRFQTALEFKDAIRQAMTEEPSVMHKASEWIQSHVLLFIGGITLIAAIIIAIVIILIR